MSKSSLPHHTYKVFILNNLPRPSWCGILELPLPHQPNACAPARLFERLADHTECVPIRQGTITGARSPRTRISPRALEHAAFFHNCRICFVPEIRSWF